MELGKFIPALCTLLGILGSSNAVDENCYYQQEVKSGLTYYVYNPGYPNYYRGRHSCLWEATSYDRIKLNCTLFDVPASRNCSVDALSVQIDNDIEYSYCGLSSFVLESKTSKMNIRFTSSQNTYGGRFVCQLTAIAEDCQCGWKNPNRIVGGVETGVNEFPMMAGLVDLVRRLLYCGATIITEKHVVTAAHCVYKQIALEDLAVVVGEHNVKKGNETNATQLYRAKKITIHPRYSSKRNDIAIIEAAGKFIFSMKVGPTCLPYLYRSETFTDEVVTALGWGTLSFAGKKSDTLMKVDLNVTSQRQCASQYDNITSNMICTYGERKDACQFDSGGPILWQSPDTHHLFLLGIISYGKTCADEAPGVNTRVTNFLDFIEDATPGYKFCKSY